MIKIRYDHNNGTVWVTQVDGNWFNARDITVVRSDPPGIEREFPEPGYRVDGAFVYVTDDKGNVTRYENPTAVHNA
jgi:hypothetical protein